MSSEPNVNVEKAIDVVQSRSTKGDKTMEDELDYEEDDTSRKNVII